MQKHCPLQAICLQETWFSSETDLSLFTQSQGNIVEMTRYSGEGVINVKTCI